MKSKIALKALLAACLGLYLGSIIPSYCQSGKHRQFSDPVFQRDAARQRRQNEYARTPRGRAVNEDYSLSDELDYYVDTDGKLYFKNKKGETYPSNGYVLPYSDWFFFPRTPGPWNNWGMGKVYVGTVRSGGYAYFDPIKYRQSLPFGSITFSFYPWCRDPWYSVYRYDPWFWDRNPWFWDPWYRGYDPWYGPWGPYGYGFGPWYPGYGPYYGPYYYGYRPYHPGFYPGGYIPGPVIVKPLKQHSRQHDYSGGGSYRSEYHTPSSMSGTTSHSHARTGGTSQTQSTPRQYYGGYTPGTYSRSAGIGSGSSSGTRGGSSSGSMSGTSSQSRASSSYESSYSRSSYSGSSYSGGSHSSGGHAGGAYSGSSSGGYSGGGSGGFSGGGGHHR
ncbi:MAG: hypothetical protein MJY62_05205 [Bacteroidales bacterium]|nr:hypothetical protein [Bacteroidales bacterium]